MQPVTLTTARLLMRPWRDEDRAPLAELSADPEVMRFYPAPLTRAESDALFDRMRAGFAERGFERWALESRASGELLGLTGLTPMPAWSPAAGGWEVGWRLRRSAWGHGYATEIAAVVEHQRLPEGHLLRSHVLYRGTPDPGTPEEPGV